MNVVVIVAFSCIAVGGLLVWYLKRFFKEPKTSTHHAFNKEKLEKRMEEIEKNPVVPIDKNPKFPYKIYSEELRKNPKTPDESFSIESVGRSHREVDLKSFHKIGNALVTHVCRVCGKSHVGQAQWYSRFGKKSLCINLKCITYKNRIFQFFLEHPAPDYTSTWLVEHFKDVYFPINKEWIMLIPEKSVLKNLLYLTREGKLVRHILPQTEVYSYRLNKEA